MTKYPSLALRLWRIIRDRRLPLPPEARQALERHRRAAPYVEAPLPKDAPHITDDGKL